MVARRDRQSSKQDVQRPESSACNAVHVIANQEWPGKNSDLAGRLIESTGHSGRVVEGLGDTPQLLQQADGRSDAQEGQSGNITDGLSQRRRGSLEASLDVKDRDESTESVDEASLDGKNRDEPTGNVDDVNCDVEIGMSGQLVSTIVT